MRNRSFSSPLSKPLLEYVHDKGGFVCILTVNPFPHIYPLRRLYSRHIFSSTFEKNESYLSVMALASAAWSSGYFFLLSSFFLFFLPIGQVSVPYAVLLLNILTKGEIAQNMQFLLCHINFNLIQ